MIQGLERGVVYRHPQGHIVSRFVMVQVAELIFYIGTFFSQFQGKVVLGLQRMLFISWQNISFLPLYTRIEYYCKLRKIRRKSKFLLKFNMIYVVLRLRIFLGTSIFSAPRYYRISKYGIWNISFFLCGLSVCFMFSTPVWKKYKNFYLHVEQSMRTAVIIVLQFCQLNQGTHEMSLLSEQII